MTERREAVVAGTESAPADATVLEALFDPSRDWREPASHHQQFHSVRLDAVDLGVFKAWPVVLDEALRLLAPNGTLALRAQDSALLSVFALKHQLHQWGELALVAEGRDPRGGRHLQLRNERDTARPMSLDGISFGLITNATTTERIAPFLDSARAVQGLADADRQLIVCGPVALGEALAHDMHDVHFVQAPQEFDELGWITRKKNMIVDAARLETLVLCHDRYEVPSDFVLALRAFGGDFDVLVPRQLREDGARYPDWVTLGDAWQWSAPAMLHYDDWTPFGYVNGGAMVAKTARLRAVPWNDLLFWNQAEDVELSRRLQAAGVVPRLARGVTLTSRSVRAGLMDAFESVPLTTGRYLLPGPRRGGGTVPTLPLDTPVRLGTRWQETAADHGVAYDDGWRAESDAIGIDEDRIAELGLRLSPRTDPVTLVLQVEASDVTPQCEVDQLVVTTLRPIATELHLHIGPVGSGAIRTRHIRVRAQGPLSVHALCVRSATPTEGRGASADTLPDVVAIRDAAERVVNRTEAALALLGTHAHATSATAPTGNAPSSSAWPLGPTGLCLADLPLLTRGARRMVVVIPGSLETLVHGAAALAALRQHVRADTIIHVVTDPSLLPLLHGWTVLPVAWSRLLNDAAYAEETAATARSWDPELVIHLTPARTLATESLMLQLPALALVGFSDGDATLPAAIDVHARPRYARLLPSGSAPFARTLMHALGLPDADAELWPHPTGASMGTMVVTAQRRGDKRVLALLGDDVASLESPALATHLRALPLHEWAIVGLGAASDFTTLQTMLAVMAPQALNLAGRLDTAGIHAVLAGADACIAGGPGLRALATLAGCDHLGD